MKSKLKTFLIAITVFAVVSDSMLIPFYPQFFAEVFGITNPVYVGSYLAATCLVVMLAFPFWAQVAKKIKALDLLVYTQLAAGIFSVACFWVATEWLFWLTSLLMLVFKGSYLLIYPLVMSLEDKSKHGGTIGMLSVVVHFGAILGALFGGAVLQLLDARDVFLVMALGDFMQMLVCLYLSKKVSKSGNAEPLAQGSAAAGSPPSAAASDLRGQRLVFKLSLVMLVFYFSAFLIRPFFASYWRSVSDLNGEIVIGFVFAVPAFMALLGLWVNFRFKSSAIVTAIVPSLMIGVSGLALQVSTNDAVIVLGRCLFGWALFQCTVRLDLLLFELSSPERYATDFSKVHFSQSLGVLIASFSAGSLVALAGLPAPFLVAAFGFLCTTLLYKFLLGQRSKPAEARNASEVSAGPERAEAGA